MKEICKHAEKDYPYKPHNMFFCYWRRGKGFHPKPPFPTSKDINGGGYTYVTIEELCEVCPCHEPLTDRSKSD